MRIETQLEYAYDGRGNKDRVFYLPSDEEARGYAALGAGRLSEAQRLLDDAIARDPSRGPRIYGTLARAQAPIAHVYWNFNKARLEHSIALAHAALEEVRERQARAALCAPMQWLQQASEALRPAPKVKLP